MCANPPELPLPIIVEEPDIELNRATDIINTPPILQRSSSAESSKLFTRAKSILTSLTRMPSISNEEKPPYFRQKSFTHRQIAEFQLNAILNDSLVTPPLPLRQLNELTKRKFTIDEAAKICNTQSYMIEKLLKAMNTSDTNENPRVLTVDNVQKITGVLNSTVGVRTLLFFKMISGNDYTYITMEQLRQFFDDYFKRIPLFSEEQLNEVFSILQHKFHLDLKSRIDFEEFYEIISHDSKLLRVISEMHIDPQSIIGEPPTPASRKKRCCNLASNMRQSFKNTRRKFKKNYLRENLSRIIIWILYILINFALTVYVCIYRVYQQKAPAALVVARVAGMLLNFNSAFIILLMLKRTITVIRTIKFLRKYIPVDDYIDFHKIVGQFIAFLSIVHTVGYMANFASAAKSTRRRNYTWLEYMFTTRPGIGWVGGFASLSGVILCIIVAVMTICSLESIRRGGHFQIFYWSHLLYWIYYVFLIVHAPNCWKFVVGPLALLILEKLYCIVTRYSSMAGRTYVEAVTIEKSDVVSLRIHRPKHFKFRPGDYISINLPSVAIYEFHPFTISSCPEEVDYISVHIKALGNWTDRVYQHFKLMSEEERMGKGIKVYRADLNPLKALTEQRSDIDARSENENRRELLDRNSTNESTIPPSERETVIIRGPYSSCARSVYDSKHVVLIAGGIGVTPYASILSSLVSQFRASRTVCKHCNRINYNKKSLADNSQLKRVDFIWVNRDHKSFEWFLGLLHQLEEEQEAYLNSHPEEKRFLDIHLFFTEIKHRKNLADVPLDLVNVVWSEQFDKDIFTSLRTKTQMSRPNWDDLLKTLISGENGWNASDVNVFFCGPKTMGEGIHRSCHKLRLRFSQEEF